MGRSFIRQDAQIRNSTTYTDSTAPSLANFETNAGTIEGDLNNLRSQCHNLLKNQAGNWYDDLNTPSALESGSQRGVNDLNTDLHAVEKKRVLRDVWKINDLYPGLDLAITLVNEIKTDYEAHRILTAGSVHGAADTTNTVSAADATDLATAITLANEIKVDYEAHRVLTAGSVHGAADSTNVVTASDATTLATLITLINDLRTQYEAHRVLIAGSVHGAADTTNTVTAAAVPSTVQVHILTSAQLPSQTTAAVGTVTTLGTVVADATSFGTAGLDEVSGTTAVSPKNLMPMVDAENHLDPILVGGKQLYGLLQTESDTDGHTMTGSASTRAQISFVVRNDTGDDLELVSISTTQGINFASRERKRFEDLNEQDFLKGVIIEFPSATTVNRQVSYDNQGTTAVNLTTNATLDLEGSGIVWKIRDDAEADLFAITEGSSGGTSEIAIEADVDVFRGDAVLNDFDNGIKVDTGAAGTTINIGVTANQIDCGGALEVASGGSGDLRLEAAGEILLDDTNFQNEATWSQAGVKVTETQAEITTYETNFGGEVSLFNAINQAYSRSGRTKGQAILQNNVVADTDVDATTSSNLDTDLPDYSGVGTFVDDVDVYLNGELLRNGADAAANEDVYPGSTPAQGMLKFEFALYGTGSKPDQLTMIVWSS
jgi:hypothetical protein